jgi:hypothetical protein
MRLISRQHSPTHARGKFAVTLSLLAERAYSNQYSRVNLRTHQRELRAESSNKLRLSS